MARAAWVLANLEQYWSLHWGREQRVCYLSQHWSQLFDQKLGMIAAAHLSVIQHRGKNQIVMSNPD